MTIKANAVLSQYLTGHERLAVAVSGGRDSMSLLAFLLENYDSKLLTVLHVEHGIRGEQSVRDAEFVEQFCKNRGVAFCRYDADIPALAKEQGVSVESAARNYRKSVYESVINAKKADYVLLAHHRGDQIESVLMHIFRGCGIGGLRAMSARDGYILRPLIDISREEIDSFIAEKTIAYREDSTNVDSDYNRNFIRNEIIPLIKSRYDVEESVLRLSESAASDEQFISSLIDETLISVTPGECRLHLNALKNHYSLASRYVMLALKKAGLECDVEKKHVLAVMELSDAQNGSVVCLPHGYRAVADYGEVVFYKEQLPVYDCTDFSVGITPFSEGYVSVFATDQIPVKGKLVFDGDKIPDSAVIRFRAEGDVFTPFGGGTKKLKEYFIDKKIARRKRDFIPLVCDGNQVLIVCGVEISDKVKVDEKTVNRLTVTYCED